MRRPETTAYLFLRCNFAKACWDSIEASVITTRTVTQIFKKVKEKLAVPFFHGDHHINGLEHLGYKE
jgi:hypothetical protein